MLLLPRLPALWAGCGGPLPMCCGRGCGGVGAQPSPAGWPSIVVRGVWCQALSLPRQPVLWGRQPGFRDPCVPGAVGVVVGNQRRPHSACPCEPSLRTVGAAEGRPQGGCLSPLSGAPEFRRPLPPAARPLGGLSGPATRVLWARACGCGGPALSPWLACPVGRCVPRGWWGAISRGGGLPLLRGASGFRRSPSRERAAGDPLSKCCGRRCGCVRCSWCLCGVCVLAGGDALRAVVCGVVLRLPLWCPPLWCFVVVLCPSCACRAPFPCASLARLLATLSFLLLLRRSSPFPVLSVGPPSSLACTILLPPPWCLSRSFSLPTSLVPILGSSSFSLAGSCKTEEGCGCGRSGGGKVRYTGDGTRCLPLRACGRLWARLYTPL